MVAGAEYPQIAVLIKHGKIAAGHGGKVRYLLAEAVGGDDIGIIPAEKVGGNGVPRLAAQKPPGDLGKGDPCGNAVGIVADKGDLLYPFPGALDAFIFTVVQGDGAVFLQQVGHRAAMPRQRRADRLPDLPDAVQHRKGPHRAEAVILAESAEAIGIPKNTGDALPFGGGQELLPDIAVKQQAAIGGKGGRHGRLFALKIVNAKVPQGAAGRKPGIQLLPFPGIAAGLPLLGQLHGAVRQQAHPAEVIAVGKGVGALGLGVDGVQGVKAARRPAHFLPADEQYTVQRGVIGKRHHSRSSPVPFW